jgi:hypothetical protein
MLPHICGGASGRVSNLPLSLTGPNAHDRQKSMEILNNKDTSFWPSGKRAICGGADLW